MSKKCKKVLIIGDIACGKTCLFVQYFQKQFSEGYVPTVIDNDTFNVEVENKTLLLEVWDTGAAYLDKINRKFYSHTHAILLCFSIDKPETLESIARKWKPDIECFCPKVPVIVVGNKTDLRNDEKTIQELELKNCAPLKHEDGQAMADRIGACAYQECSAKLNEGVADVFDAAVQAAVKHKIVSTSNCCCILL